MKQLSLKEIQDKYASGVSVSSAILRKLQRDPRSGARRLYKVLAKRYEDQKKERNRLDAMLHFERLLWKAGIQHIAGVDEVGMGPLAGPVVAAAVVYPPGTEIEGIDDSKALDEETRVRLDEEIRKNASAFAIGIVEVDEIDRLNIYHAGIRAMQVALSSLPVAPQHILVDSRTIPGFTQPQNSFDKGDGINFSIASASIVAKVFRECIAGDFSDCTCHFNTGWSTTDDNEGHCCIALCFVCRFFGKFERQKNSPAQLNRIFKTFQSWCELFPLIVAEVRMAGAAGDDQVVIMEYPVFGFHLFCFHIHRFNFSEDDFNVFAFAQNRANRGGNVRGR